MTVVDPDALWRALPAALEGAGCLAPAPDAAALAMLRPEVPLEDPGTALIVATSGSTGRPKGVVVRHRPAINLTDWAPPPPQRTSGWGARACGTAPCPPPTWPG